LHITTIFRAHFLTTTCSNPGQSRPSLRQAGVQAVASLYPLIFFALKAQSIVALFFTEHYILLYFFERHPYIGSKNKPVAARQAATKPETSNPTARSAQVTGSEKNGTAIRANTTYSGGTANQADSNNVERLKRGMAPGTAPSKRDILETEGGNER